jgi:hypothetical protein
MTFNGEPGGRAAARPEQRANLRAKPLRRLTTPGPGTTHWGDGPWGDRPGPATRGCWAVHDLCAITEVERLRAEVARLSAERE